MLTITVPGIEFFDEENQEFIELEEMVLQLEHSLVALSKWESKWEKPFLTDDPKSNEEALSYIECMIVTPEFPPGVTSRLTDDNLEEINNYISAKMTATWFSETPKAARRREIITSELIYYWMTAFNISIECEKWHLSRLFTLIQVCNAKNETPKQRSYSEIASERRRLNEQRKRELGTRG